MSAETTGAVREALDELTRYLSDEIPPLMVADSANYLLRCPATLTASAIQNWIGAQYRGFGTRTLVSDYIYHAL